MDAFAWPICSLLFGGFSLYMLRQPISALIGRIKSANVGRWGGFDSSPNQSTGKDMEPDPTAKLMAVFDDSVMVESEQIIRDELNKLPVDIRAKFERIAGLIR